MVVGCVLGILGGACRDLSFHAVPAGPFSYTMDARLALIMLVAIYQGPITAGDHRVLINTPGPSTAATCFDGYRSASRGRREKPWALRS